MYVVRIIPDIGDGMDTKAFERLPDAMNRFQQGWAQTDEGEFRSIAVFDVPGVMDVRAACDAVRRADASIRLVEIKESYDAEIKKLLPKLDFDL